ncbi:hypothetical protein BDQ17DRAFT_1339014, partial [Cyathus striatus]
LSPVGKKYSETVCPQLEVLECDPKIITGITERGLRKFVEARRQAHRSDRRIAALRKLCLSINDYKREVKAHEKILLGSDSAVYFKKRVENNLFSPSEGSAVWLGEERRKYQNEVQQEIYTEL